MKTRNHLKTRIGKKLISRGNVKHFFSICFGVIFVMLAFTNCGNKESAITILLPDGEDGVQLTITGASGEIGVIDSEKANIEGSKIYYMPLNQNGTVIFHSAENISIQRNNEAEVVQLVAKVGYEYHAENELGLSKNEQSMTAFQSGDAVVIFVSASTKNVLFAAKNYGVVEKLKKYEIKVSSEVVSSGKKLAAVTFDEAVAYYRKNGFYVDTEMSITSSRLFNREFGGERFAKIIINENEGDIVAMLIEFASEVDFNSACEKTPKLKSSPKRGLVVCFSMDSKDGGKVKSLFESMKK